MTVTSDARTPFRNPDQLFVDGRWVAPTTGSTLTVLDSNDEEVFLKVAEAGPDDVAAAVAAARLAFDEGPWPRLSHAERAIFLRAIAEKLRERTADIGDMWARETGAVLSMTRNGGPGAARFWDGTADLVDTFAWEEQHTAADGGFGLLVREPVGVVAAIIPWNSPILTMSMKLAPALLAGCTTIVKASPEAPGAAYVFAEIAEELGLPPGVVNILTADREVSELLVRDPRVDKVSFTGSTVAGRRIGAIMSERIGRVALELGGKSAAIVLDDADLEATAESLTHRGTLSMTYQGCVSLTRVVVQRNRHDAMLEALAEQFRRIRVGLSVDETSQMGPLASEAQLERVTGYIGIGKSEGATLAAGGGRPADLPRGYFVEPTVFGNVDNSSRLAQEEIFGPVVSVIAADDEADAIRIANDTIYGLSGAVFTADVDRARRVAGQMRTGTIGHNGLRSSTSFGFGGWKQSGIGREGGAEGIRDFTESKSIVLDGPPAYLT